MRYLYSWAPLSLLSFLLFVCSYKTKAQPTYLPPDYPQELPSNSLIYWSNDGQVLDTDGNSRSDIKYYSTLARPAQLFFGTEAIHFVRTHSDSIAGDSAYRLDMTFWCKDHKESDDPTTGRCLPAPKAFEMADTKLNFFLPHTAPMGVSGVSGFQRVVYEEVHDGIDIHFYSNALSHKVYFVIKPHADPGQIHMLFNGQDSIVQQQTGDLRMFLNNKSFEFNQFFAYQDDGAGNLNLLPWQPAFIQNTPGHIEIAHGSYDPNQYLIYSAGMPVPRGSEHSDNLGWSTYLGGGTHNDRGYDVASGDSNDVFVTGYTRSSDFPVQSGFFTTPPGVMDNIFVARFRGDEAAMQWATYYGGSNEDLAYAIVNDHDGHIWITGTTESNDFYFPMSNQGAFIQGTKANKRDAYILKLRQSNSEPLYASFIGGEGAEYATSIAVDNAKHIFIGGWIDDGSLVSTSCSAPTNGGFPVCNAGNGSFEQTIHQGGEEGFILEFSNGGELLWSTLFGGSENDRIIELDINKLTNHVYAVGRTNSPIASTSYSAPCPANSSGQFPVCWTGDQNTFFQSTLSGNLDGFVVRFDEDRKLQWSSYFGGNQNDRLEAVTSDATGKVYLAGVSSSMLTTTHCHDGQELSGLFPKCQPGSSADWQDNQGASDAFLVRLQSDAITWSTFLGGSTNESNYSFGSNVGSVALDVDDANNLYIVGSTALSTLANDFPVQPYSNYYMQPAILPGSIKEEAFVAVYRPSSEKKIWATLLGGAGWVDSTGQEGFDQARSVALYGNKYLYVTGSTAGYGFPIRVVDSSITYFESPDFSSFYQKAFMARFDVWNIATSVKELNTCPSSDLLLFPNPASTEFTIQFINHGHPQVLKVYNSHGQLVWQQQIQSSSGVLQRSIDMRSWVSGLYYLNISDGEAEYNAKIVKK